MSSKETNDDRHLEIPPRLQADLAALDARGGTPVPSEVDEAVLRLARRRLVGVPRRRRRLRLAAVAAAASLLLALFFWGSYGGARMDVDGNGRIDILDAYGLAIRVEAGEAFRREWDFNGDGEVDDDDVDLIAYQAVRIR